MSSQILEVTVKSNDAGQTLFNFLKKMLPTTSLSVIYKLFRNKKIKVNNKSVKDRKYLLAVNDKILIFDKNIEIVYRPTVQTQVNNKNNTLKIVYEDENLLIVDKPHGVEMHSTLHDSLDQSVRNYLINTNQYDPNYEQSFLISHVHRLDKFTRGLVIYAKNKATLDSLLTKINDKKYIVKKYLAQCQGNFPADLTTVRGYLYKDEQRKRMVFSPKKVEESQECETSFKVIKPSVDSTWLEVTLTTGRKHQIRATLSYLKHPVVNDQKYGAKRINPNFMIALYAYQIEFHHFSGNLEYLNEKIIKIEENIIK
ncbi:ribosomal large subunit pseudouridine synthase C [Spiroplasma syrphidicola EA-1]|uniref:RNA pseudouridylate synthase n=1 Tax=Spiroplasma syrphidicola EA-1 TaxID=1276229 RepID=R4UEG1_9MOLU|nr:RluA family pseudouridine synthase [Spiroplasma syrphidicola]AGM26319.1 ribosomal large subunit pseudouridine synthase C [Spiroplasma syrphidicola EA-1]